MQKYRIYELAKIYNKGNDEIIAVLNKNNIEVKNRLNSVDEKAKEILDKAFASPSVKKNKARRRKYKKNLILHITQLYQNL